MQQYQRILHPARSFLSLCNPCFYNILRFRSLVTLYSKQPLTAMLKIGSQVMRTSPVRRRDLNFSKRGVVKVCSLPRGLHVHRERTLRVLIQHQTARFYSKTQDRSREIYTVPNAICLARIAASPFIGYLVLNGSFELGLYCFVAAGISDGDCFNTSFLVFSF